MITQYDIHKLTGGPFALDIWKKVVELRKQIILCNSVEIDFHVTIK